VVSVTDPYGRILGFLDRRSYYFFQVVFNCTHEAESIAFGTHYVSENLVVSGIESGSLDLQPGTLPLEDTGGPLPQEYYSSVSGTRFCQRLSLVRPQGLGKLERFLLLIAVFASSSRARGHTWAGRGHFGQLRCGMWAKLIPQHGWSLLPAATVRISNETQATFSYL
jgi:hypothetical protein